jgi:hypothetical protein
MNNTSNYRFTLDIQSTMSQASLPVRLGDTNRSLFITITEGGNPYILHDGFTAAFVGTKSNGDHLFNHCIIENKSVVRYDFTAQTANVAGLVDCEIRIYDPEGFVVTSPKFVMVVDERVIYDRDIEFSADEATFLDEIVLTEKNRVNAESGRASAETARSTAEDLRAVAENARATAEAGRSTNFNSFMSESEHRYQSLVEQFNAALGSSDTNFNSFMTESEQRFQSLVDQFNVAIGSSGKRATWITLLASAWVGDASPYSQVVEIESVTAYSQVDLLPSAEQLVEFKKKDLDLVTENEDGVITVFAIGTKPIQDWTIQATVTEVSA